ncbi:hypothetical protein [Umezawaea beigongshangensis]|uniref:hypothetical protein n=1 Tax=Umezawaea beigongshangensis TaxID=2780383 RepID=UPI0018F25BE4|nr:hypothetical protein [Umezawaea beigongshangensis]
MNQRKPLSRKAWTLLAVAGIVTSTAIGVVLGVLAPEARWLAHVVLLVLLTAALVGVRVLGGFEQLEAARRRNRDRRS